MTLFFVLASFALSPNSLFLSIPIFDHVFFQYEFHIQKKNDKYFQLNPISFALSLHKELINVLHFFSVIPPLFAFQSLACFLVFLISLSSMALSSFIMPLPLYFFLFTSFLLAYLSPLLFSTLLPHFSQLLA